MKIIIAHEHRRRHHTCNKQFIDHVENFFPIEQHIHKHVLVLFDFCSVYLTKWRKQTQ